MIDSSPRRGLAGAKFLFVVSRFHTNIYFATRALLGAGAEVRVFAGAAGPDEDHRHLTPELFEMPGDGGRLKRAIDDFAPDATFVRDSCDLAPAAFAAGRFGKHRMFLYNQRPMYWQPPWERRIARRVKGLTLRRVTPVPGTRPERPACPRSIYLPWPVGILGQPSPTPATPDEEPLRLLCVGKLAQPRKNQDRLIDALDRLPDPNDLRLTLAGNSTPPKKTGDPGHYDRISRRVDVRDASLRVDIRPDVPFAQMRALYEEHHVCILPSSKEPLGSSPIEAMAYGVVPIIERSCGSAGYLTDGVDGYLMDIDDPEAFATRIAHLARDRALLAKLSDAARHTAETELSEVRFLERISELVAGN